MNKFFVALDQFFSSRNPSALNKLPVWLKWPEAAGHLPKAFIISRINLEDPIACGGGCALYLGQSELPEANTAQRRQVDLEMCPRMLLTDNKSLHLNT